jgi:beta-xylosidase
MKRAFLTFCCIFFLVACGQGTQQAAAPNVAPTGAAPTGAPTMAAPAATVAPTIAPPSADQFQNPVLRADFPDPHIIEVGGTYYAYATNGASKNIQFATSPDLITWKIGSDAMPALAPWVRLSEPLVWAPEVLQIGDQFLLYYTARDDESNRQCVGVAVATKPEGKFRDTNERPFVCQVAEGGTIDASPFRDTDGTLYLYYKNDGNCCGQATYLYVQEMAPDGLSLVGEPTRLVRNDRAWEGGVVEAPTMWVHEGRYYLFFSANSFSGLEYAVGYATCETAIGPCEDAPENPILASVTDQQPLVVGPGHQTIVQTDDGETWLVYHTWEVARSGQRGTRRLVWMDQLVWNEGVPDVEGPTTGPQPRP